jgi:hypothetical protein
VTTILHDIDYPELREQKSVLLTLLDYIADPDSTALRGHPMPRHKAMDALQGIVNLLDTVQDEAVKFQIAQPYEVYATDERCVYCHLPIYDDGLGYWVDTTGGDVCGVPLDSGKEHDHCNGFDSYSPDPDVCNGCRCHRLDHPDVGVEPSCDVCGALAEDESVDWCGECGCCVEHCQKFVGCPA